MSTVTPATILKCRAKDPATCRVHGKPPKGSSKATQKAYADMRKLLKKIRETSVNVPVLGANGEIVPRHDELELHIADIFRNQTNLKFNDKTYDVDFSEKPVYLLGEGKTDVFVRLQEQGTGETLDLKISIKKENADFVENKIGARRAQAIFGENYQEVLEEAATTLKNQLEDVNPYVPKKNGICLGYRIDVVNKPGVKNHRIEDLNRNQLKDFYAGNTLDDDKKHATVNGETVRNSGVATHVLQGDTFNTPQEVLNRLQTVPEYVNQNPDLYITARAINLRKGGKYERSRPLGLYYVFTEKPESKKKLPEWSLKLDTSLTETSTNKYNELPEVLKNLQH